MLPSEIMHRSLTGHRKRIADAVGVSEPLVDRWCMPPESCGGAGSASPLQRVLEIILALRLAGAEDPDAILAYLCQELGYLPPMRIDAAPLDPTSMQVLASATKEHADILSTWARALSNSLLSVTEAEDFRREIRELLVVLGGWDAGLQRFLVTDETSLIRRRLGPNRALPKFSVLRNRAAIA